MHKFFFSRLQGDTREGSELTHGPHHGSKKVSQVNLSHLFAGTAAGIPDFEAQLHRLSTDDLRRDGEFAVLKACIAQAMAEGIKRRAALAVQILCHVSRPFKQRLQIVTHRDLPGMAENSDRHFAAGNRLACENIGNRLPAVLPGEPGVQHRIAAAVRVSDGERSSVDQYRHDRFPRCKQRLHQLPLRQLQIQIGIVLVFSAGGIHRAHTLLAADHSNDHIGLFGSGKGVFNPALQGELHAAARRIEHMLLTQQRRERLAHRFCLRIVALEEILLSFVDLALAALAEILLDKLQDLCFLLRRGGHVKNDTALQKLVLALGRVDLQHHSAEVVQLAAVEVQVGGVHRAYAGVAAEEGQDSVRRGADNGYGQILTQREDAVVFGQNDGFFRDGAGQGVDGGICCEHLEAPLRCTVVQQTEPAFYGKHAVNGLINAGFLHKTFVNSVHQLMETYTVRLIHVNPRCQGLHSGIRAGCGGPKAVEAPLHTAIVGDHRTVKAEFFTQ